MKTKKDKIHSVKDPVKSIGFADFHALCDVIVAVAPGIREEDTDRVTWSTSSLKQCG
jgi:hypothetical protein